MRHGISASIRGADKSAGGPRGNGRSRRGKPSPGGRGAALVSACAAASPDAPSHPPHRPNPPQPAEPLEGLERRVLLSTYTVTSTADVAATDPAYVGTLRWAVAQANAADAPASGPSVIAFDPGAFASTQTITLTQGQLELTQGATNINGAGALRVSGNNASRVLAVDAGVAATVSDLTLQIGNAGAGANGGGVLNAGVLTLTGAYLPSDQAGVAGGGVYNSGTLTVTGSTFTADSADTGALADGGTSGTLTVYDSTISGNTALPAILTDRPVTLDNTIVAANAGGDLNAYTLFSNHGSFSGSNNLIGNGAGQSDLANGAAGNQVGTAAAPLNPGLGPLAGNGGPTQTMALLAASPALDKGGNGLVPSAVTTDQRGGGYARVANGTVDVGAYELQAAAPAPAVVSVTPQDPAGKGAAAGSTGGQRSIVSQLVVTFSEPVNLSPGAFTLGLFNDYGSGANNGSPDTDASAILGAPINPSNDGLTWVVPVVQSGASTTYSYNLSGGGGGACLQDGVYRLSVTAAGGGTPMASNFTSPLFHRLFGDTDGNKTVNPADYARFKQSFGSAVGSAAFNPDLDIDGNGSINAADYAQFKKRFGMSFTY